MSGRIWSRASVVLCEVSTSIFMANCADYTEQGTLKMNDFYFLNSLSIGKYILRVMIIYIMLLG